MNENTTRNLIVIAGPTAVGKSDIAFRLAQYFQTAILSADSRQCFKEMSIGTAKPTQEQLDEVAHYFINTHSIEDEISAGKFELYALDVLEKIFLKNKVAIVCGGTGLYLSALLYGMDEMPKVDKDIEATVIREYELKGIGWLQETIKKQDPEFALQGAMDNPNRMLRALSFVQTHQQSILNFRLGKKKERNFKIIPVGLELPREELYQRINNRVDTMLAQGLIEEAKTLFPLRHHKNLLTVGYQEFYEGQDTFPEDDQSIQVAVDKIKQHSRNYAKRQMTWFKNRAQLRWFHPRDWEGILKFVEQELGE